MRKVLVAVLCLVFLGACTRKDVEEQTEIPGSGLALAVRSGDSLIAAGIPAAVYDLTDLGVNEPCTPLYFAVDEKISFTDLDAGVHTFFVLGNKTEEYNCLVSLDGDDMKTVQLRWEDYRLPELLGGVVKVNGANEVEMVEMTRLVGGLTVNVLNKDEYARVEVNLKRPYTGLDTIWFSDYALVPQYYNSYYLEAGVLAYCFPESTPVKGEIFAYDEFGNTYYFDFESSKCIEQNQKLTLNITLERASSIARSAKVRNTVTCVEEVSEL